jgi:hypothetical protein
VDAGDEDVVAIASPDNFVAFIAIPSPVSEQSACGNAKNVAIHVDSAYGPSIAVDVGTTRRPPMTDGVERVSFSSSQGLIGKSSVTTPAPRRIGTTTSRRMWRGRRGRPRRVACLWRFKRGGQHAVAFLFEGHDLQFRVSTTGGQPKTRRFADPGALFRYARTERARLEAAGWFEVP